MKVFISWSGDLSRAVAELLHDWLPSVIQTIDPFVSTESIEKGSRWAAQLAVNLKASAFGIICLTQDNLQSPWMTFEAGALSEGLSADRVCPLLVDVAADDVQGPLAGFQCTGFVKADLLKLVGTMNRACGDAAVDAARLGRLFDALWPELESGVNAALAAHADSRTDDTTSVPSSRTFTLIPSRGTLINPSDQSRNIAFKVDTINLLFEHLAASLSQNQSLDETREVFEEAGYRAGTIFAERVYERWGLDYPEDTITDRIDRWCRFDSDVGWGRLISDIALEPDGETISGSVRLLDNFQAYRRKPGEFPDCFLMHGYVRGVLESLTDGAPLSVTCDVDVCPLHHRRSTDCVFRVAPRSDPQ